MRTHRSKYDMSNYVYYSQQTINKLLYIQPFICAKRNTVLRYRSRHSTIKSCYALTVLNSLLIQY